MATFSTQTSNFSNTVVALVHARILENLRAGLPHLSPGSFIPAEFVKGTNGTHRYVAYPDAAAQTTTLTEGTAPGDQALTIATNEFTAAQKGGVFSWTDLGEAESPHDIIAVNAERSGRQAVLTMDEIARVLYRDFSTAAYVNYSNGSARSAVSAALTGAMVKKMAARLRNADVPPFDDGYYRAIVSPRAVYDLETDTANGGWMDVWKYTSGEPLLNGEVGAYAGVKFMVSSRATSFVTSGASNVDVLRSVFLGKEALAWTGADSIATYFIPRGGDHSDPLAQLGRIGWKAWVGGVVIDASGAGPRLQVLEHAGTVLATGQA